MRSGRPIKAKRYFKTAIEKGSSSAMVYKHYADLLLQDGKGNESIKLMKKAIELDPLNAELYAFLSRVYRRTGEKDDKKEAERLIALAREIDPDNIDFELVIAELLEKTDDEDTPD